MGNQHSDFGVRVSGSPVPPALVDTGPGTTSSSYALRSTQWLSGEFTITEPVTIETLEGWIHAERAQDVGRLLTATVYTDGGTVPGSELYSAAFAIEGTEPDWCGPSGLSWQLAPGTYWASFEGRPGQENSWGRMSYDVPDPLDLYAYTHQGSWMGNQHSDFGVRINGPTATDPNAIPEPMTMLAVALSAAGLGGYVRRRHVS